MHLAAVLSRPLLLFEHLNSVAMPLNNCPKSGDIVPAGLPVESGAQISESFGTLLHLTRPPVPLPPARRRPPTLTEIGAQLDRIEGLLREALGREER
jgi:hypothetical protein